MEPVHEESESGPASRPEPFPSVSPPISESDPNNNHLHNNDAPTVTDSLSSGVSVGNGTVLPQSDKVTPSATTTRDRSVSGVIPPYWGHYRNPSRTSQTSIDQSPVITLEDHTEDPNSETSRGLWARSVSVDDHAVVQGKSGVGAYVVWNCKIQTLDVRGHSFCIHTLRTFVSSNCVVAIGRSDCHSHEVGFMCPKSALSRSCADCFTSRYSEFDTLRQQLSQSFPHAKNALPALPPKSVLCMSLAYTIPYSN